MALTLKALYEPDGDPGTTGLASLGLATGQASLHI